MKKTTVCLLLLALVLSIMTSVLAGKPEKEDFCDRNPDHWKCNTGHTDYDFVKLYWSDDSVAQDNITTALTQIISLIWG